jgi:hypothetical protein
MTGPKRHCEPKDKLREVISTKCACGRDCFASLAMTKKRTYRTSSRIARSSPSSVSGYIRPPISWRMARIDWV